jgi:aconitate hydratase
MVRGTFANVRLHNELVPGIEGGWTRHFPDEEGMTVYDAAMRYQEEGVPLLVITGKEYGTGSSRDWAAKGVSLLDVRAVIAESYERIHRSNLVGMGVLPLEFAPGFSRVSLGLTGAEVYHIEGLSEGLEPKKQLIVRAVAADNSETSFPALTRIDSPLEIEQYRHGGILPFILRKLVSTT